MEDYPEFMRSLESNIFEECSSDSKEFADANSVKNSSDLASKNSRWNARLPTRRPDPNVSNRNALMARENRRKKKAQVEDLEKDLEQARGTSRHLLKAMKKQTKTIEKLEREKKYYQSVLQNQTAIHSLLSALNCLLHPTPHNSADAGLNQQKCSKLSDSPKVSTSCSSNSSISTPVHGSCGFESLAKDELIQQVLRQDSFLSPSCSSVYSEPFESFKNFDSFSFLENGWNDLQANDVGDESLLKFNNSNEVASSETCNTALHVPNEHNYVASVDKALSTSEHADDVGICLHINQGKVSLEYCVNCHWNARHNRTS